MSRAIIRVSSAMVKQGGRHLSAARSSFSLPRAALSRKIVRSRTLGTPHTLFMLMLASVGRERFVTPPPQRWLEQRAGSPVATPIGQGVPFDTEMTLKFHRSVLEIRLDGGGPRGCARHAHRAGRAARAVRRRGAARDQRQPHRPAQQSAVGAGDLTLARRFLNRSVPPELPWAHWDRSGAPRASSLGHINTDIAGFGVRFTLELPVQENLPRKHS